MLVAAISATAFRKEEMWAWYAFWASLLFFDGDIIINISIGGTTWTTDGIFLAVGIGTLLVPPEFESMVSKRQRSLASENR